MTLIKTQYCFTIEQLRFIIHNYLSLPTLYEYFQACLKATRISNFCLNPVFTPNTQESPKKITSIIHSDNQAHPIKIYHNHLAQPLNTEYLQDEPHEYYILYPIQQCISILNSKEFYDSLPNNIIFNNLLTSINVNIICQTLRIIAQLIKPKIQATLRDNEYREFQYQQHIFRAIDQTSSAKKQQSLKAFQRASVDNQSGLTDYNFQSNRLWALIQCQFCSNYKKFLFYNKTLAYYQNTKLQTKSVQQLKLIKELINIVLLYQKQHHTISIPNSYEIINKILYNIGIVIDLPLWKQLQIQKKLNAQDRQDIVPNDHITIDAPSIKTAKNKIKDCDQDPLRSQLLPIHQQYNFIMQMQLQQPCWQPPQQQRVSVSKQSKLNECYAKEQKQIYNTMQVNGDIVRNGVLQQLKNGKAIILENYKECMQYIAKKEQSQKDDKTNTIGSFINKQLTNKSLLNQSIGNTITNKHITKAQITKKHITCKQIVKKHLTIKDKSSSQISSRCILDNNAAEEQKRNKQIGDKIKDKLVSQKLVSQKLLANDGTLQLRRKGVNKKNIIQSILRKILNQNAHRFDYDQ